MLFFIMQNIFLYPIVQQFKDNFGQVLKNMTSSSGYMQFSSNDEWMTPRYALRDFFSYTKIDKQYRIWEPFYGDGRSTNIMKTMGYDVIECEGKDFFSTPIPTGNVILVSNIPFSIKKQILQFIFLEANIERFAILLPVNTFYTKYFHEILEKTENRNVNMLIPHARIQYTKNGKKISYCALDTAWMVSGIDLPTPRHGMHFMPAIGPRDA